METQHRVFVVTGDGSNTFFVHVWVADVSIWIKMCGWRLLPQPDLRLPSRTSAWWKGTSTLCWGVGSERRRRDPFLEMGQGKDAAMVEWSVGMVTLNITVTLPRMTWVAICDWVATVLSDDEQANPCKPPHIIDAFDFIRPSRGDEFLASQDWPMRATAPTLEEVEAGHCDWMVSDDNNWMTQVVATRDAIAWDVAGRPTGWEVTIKTKQQGAMRSVDWADGYWSTGTRWRRCTPDGQPMMLPETK